MPKLKPGTIVPTPEEDAAITAAAISDPDNPPLTDAELSKLKRMRGHRGKQRAPTKIPTTIRFDADVLADLKATGRGWQTRVNAMVREWLDAHRSEC
jgi:uncharacterized protein (DUF4415 family)